MFCGAPRSATSASKALTVCSAVMLRSQCITSASRVNSSTMFNSRGLLSNGAKTAAIAASNTR
jgi:hypothetical protein